MTSKEENLCFILCGSVVGSSPPTQHLGDGCHRSLAAGSNTKCEAWCKCCPTARCHGGAAVEGSASEKSRWGQAVPCGLGQQPLRLADSGRQLQQFKPWLTAVVSGAGLSERLQTSGTLWQTPNRRTRRQWRESRIFAETPWCYFRRSLSSQQEFKLAATSSKLSCDERKGEKGRRAPLPFRSVMTALRHPLKERV